MIFKVRKHKEDIEKLRNEVVRLIDESNEAIYKVVFYSLDEVQEIMNKVMDKWERSGKQGRPIDYASPEEVKVLHKIAKKLASRSPAELLVEYRELFTSY
ncbi:MAG: hypothetical protein QXE28_02975 [Desulfurococcaceae archaeon]